jgi:hypothetical protein
MVVKLLFMFKQIVHAVGSHETWQEIGLMALISPLVCRFKLGFTKSCEGGTAQTYNLTHKTCNQMKAHNGSCMGPLTNLDRGVTDNSMAALLHTPQTDLPHRQPSVARQLLLYLCYCQAFQQ